TKVVTFGAFVEILDGVEGLVHISELAAHHVENPREVVQPGDVVRVKILEIDSERRRLSLSIKRVEGQVLPSEVRAREAGLPLPGEGAGPGDLDDVPELGLSEDVFAGEGVDGEVAVDDADAAAEETALPVEAAADAEGGDEAAAEGGDEAPAAEGDDEAPAAEGDEAPAAEAEADATPSADEVEAEAEAAPQPDPAPEAEAAPEGDPQPEA
ncbi:MAG: rpsA, partial [Conexibacter sp.]|nr:rpsA [Conexibacter sp.]